MTSEDELDRKIKQEQANEELLKDENYDYADFDKFQAEELDLLKNPTSRKKAQIRLSPTQSLMNTTKNSASTQMR